MNGEDLGFCVATGDEPTTCTVKVEVRRSSFFRTPKITPVEGSRCRPPGNVPDVTDQVYRGMPLTACTVPIYGWP